MSVPVLGAEETLRSVTDLACTLCIFIASRTLQAVQATAVHFFVRQTETKLPLLGLSFVLRGFAVRIRALVPSAARTSDPPSMPPTTIQTSRQDGTAPCKTM